MNHSTEPLYMIFTSFGQQLRRNSWSQLGTQANAHMEQSWCSPTTAALPATKHHLEAFLETVNSCDTSKKGKTIASFHDWLDN